MTDELKPCPFCGHIPFIDRWRSVTCSYCNISMDMVSWNTRHEPRELPEWLIKEIHHLMENTPEFAENYSDIFNYALEKILSLKKPEE